MIVIIISISIILQSFHDVVLVESVFFILLLNLIYV